MQVNVDLTRVIRVRPRSADWVSSPQPGVQRLLLAREGEEVAKAVSLVHFAPGSHFPWHTHGGGEEILVLEGVFSDETGDYPVGSYLRNPPGSTHAPFSKPGCLIFVRLWQFAPDDQRQCAQQTLPGVWEPLTFGRERQHLHQHAEVNVALYRCSAGVRWTEEYPGGLELLMLEGQLSDGQNQYEAGDWVRLPRGSRIDWQVLQASRFYCQSGHLGQYSCWDQRLVKGD